MYLRYSEYFVAGYAAVIAWIQEILLKVKKSKLFQNCLNFFIRIIKYTFMYHML